MKGIFSIIAMSFESEFSKLHNLLGWGLTASVWSVTSIEKVNTVLTVVLSTCSIIWVLVKIYIAIKQYQKGK
jgi:hypothetical protein